MSIWRRSWLPGSVVAAEMDLINQRYTGTPRAKETVLPLSRDGEVDSAFPPFLRGYVYADFTSDEGYFVVLFDLLLTLYDIPADDVLVRDMRHKLQDERNGMLKGKRRSTPRL